MKKRTLALCGLGLMLALAGSAQAIMYTHSFTAASGSASSTAALGGGDYLIAFSGSGGTGNDNFLVKEYSGGALAATYDVGYVRLNLAEGTTYPTGMDVAANGDIHIVSNNYSGAGGDEAAYTVIDSSGGALWQNQTIQPMIGGIELDPAGDAWLGGNYSAAHLDGTDGSTINVMTGVPGGYGAPPISVDQATGTVWYGGYSAEIYSWDPPSEVTTQLFPGYVPAFGSGPGEFSGAACGGIVAQGGKVYIGDITNNKVLIYAMADGSFIQELVAPQAGGIQDIDVDPAGNVYGMSDRGNVGMNVWLVPEPITMSLLGLGGLVLIRRKK